MGKPKFSRKQYETPSHPWQEDRIKAENELTKKYGLKNKKEVWKAQTRLRKYRGQAREFSARLGSDDIQSKKESDQLIMHLSRMNFLPPNSSLDDVLALEIESILSRRLQTLTYLKGLASTPTQARQLICHGHILIGDRRVTVPGYLVTKDEEGEVGYSADSPLNDIMHPARPRTDFRSAPIKKEIKPEEAKEEIKEEKPTKEAPNEEKSSEPEQKEKIPAETAKEEPPEPEKKPPESVEPTKDEGPEKKPVEEAVKKPVEKPKEEKAGKENKEAEGKSDEIKEGGN